MIAVLLLLAQFGLPLQAATLAERHRDERRLSERARIVDGTANLPTLALTPGLTRPLSTHAVCTVKWGRDVRHVTLAMKKQVFAAYGIPWSEHAKYEVDHLISRELAGADDVRNLWPQSWKGEWNAHMKDRLENRLHVLVCSGQMTLGAAQDAIKTDWTTAFARYVEAK